MGLALLSGFGDANTNANTDTNQSDNKSASKSAVPPDTVGAGGVGPRAEERMGKKVAEILREEREKVQVRPNLLFAVHGGCAASEREGRWNLAVEAVGAARERESFLCWTQARRT